MHGFIVENISEDHLMLQFSDGLKIWLRPSSKYCWRGINQDVRFLQDLVDKNQLDVWVFYPQEEYKIDWRQEGF